MNYVILIMDFLGLTLQYKIRDIDHDKNIYN